ncbi:MAG: NAD-dependent epimerase/dehydratase family protein [Planctomycetota bacterium]
MNAATPSAAYSRIVVTGGAGFVGSHLALALADAYPGAEVVAADNLVRRGSELALERLADRGVRFVHADVRDAADVAALGACDLVVDCAAEPSVLAGRGDGSEHVVRTNLVGTLNTLELARRAEAAFLFVSTSRVYPHRAIENLPLRAEGTRYVYDATRPVRGAGPEGISEDFALDGPRTLYGATKLASELLVTEYADQNGMRVLVDRCGVIAGPGQMGKQDQGFLVHWIARHLFGGELAYIGYDGLGLQVRDVLHVDDLARLVVRQVADIERVSGGVYNVGGGAANSVSLRELTEMCSAATGRTLDVGSDPRTRPGDVRWYVTDARRACAEFDWRPEIGMEELVETTTRWIRDGGERLRRVLIGDGAREVAR